MYNNILQENNCKNENSIINNDFNSFDDFFNKSFEKLNYSYSSRLKLKEIDSNYEFAIDLPGYCNKDIETSIDNYILTIIAKNEKRGEIKRNVSISSIKDNIDIEKISGKIENGVLTIKLGKIDKEKSKKIKID
jgi:HSP20 family molecular chaperone IbpA